MASIINASTTSTSGLVQTADASGVLQLQSNGVTGLQVAAGGKVSLPSTMLGTASAGTLEYDGQVPYFTPLGTQRGVVPGMQYYRLNSALVGLNATGAQNTLGVGVTLSSNTVYQFEAIFPMSKTAGTTSHHFQLGYGGTATINNIAYSVLSAYNQTSFTSAYTSTPGIFVQTTTATTLSTGLIANATVYWIQNIKGTVSINAGGTFIPQYSLSAAPGGAYTTAAGSYFLIYPIGAAGSNINVGTWA